MSLSIAACIAIHSAVTSAYRSPFPDLGELRLSASSAVCATSFLALGMRRLAADIEFIQLLMYYGTPEHESQTRAPAGEAGRPEETHAHSGEAGRSEQTQAHPGKAEVHEHGHRSYGAGHYPEIGPRVLRTIRLDPFFSYAALYGAGALAFNLGRPDEALDLLREAAGFNPREWRFRVYTAAIGFHKQGNPERVVSELSPVSRQPDCPALIKHLLAFLNRRLGRMEEATRLYKDILESPDPTYHAIAARALAELGQAPAHRTP